MSSTPQKRERDDNKYLVVILIDGYGDTSPYPCKVHKLSEQDKDKIRGEDFYRTLPEDRLQAGMDFEQQPDQWQSLPEKDLLQFTRDHHCEIVVAYLNE